MRAIITLFLIFTPVLVISAPAKVLSQVCSRKYVEGVKRERPNGQIVRECLYRATLPDSYETDTASRCSRTHVEGSWVFSSNSFHYKLCFRKENLASKYLTHYKNMCAFDYEAVGNLIVSEYDFPQKVCEKIII